MQPVRDVDTSLLKPLIIGTILGFLMVVGLVAYARAHSWYPMDCCSDYDCAIVVKTSFVASDPKVPANMVVETVYGTAVVPHNFPLRQSKDGQTHACIDKQGRLLCLFVPPSM
jgi:hypothetical protein